MSNNKTDGNDSDGVECPTCGKTLSSRVGMKSHHKQAHGERVVAFDECICEVCGDSFKAYNPEKRVTCSKECFAEQRAEDWTGKGNPNTAEKVTIECSVCGTPFKVYPSVADHRQTCGDDECYRAHMREVNLRENSALWEGGYEPYYGAIWEEKRKEALERDGYECRVCGISNEKHNEKYGAGLSVHHITPLSEFENVENAHSLDNLISLCKDHHGEWEKIPLQPTLD